MFLKLHNKPTYSSAYVYCAEQSKINAYNNQIMQLSYHIATLKSQCVPKTDHACYRCGFIASQHCASVDHDSTEGETCTCL